MFNVNQIVKGKRAGTFIILAFRSIGGEQYAQVKEFCQVTGKEFCQVTGKARRGEMSLPLDALVAI